MKKTIIIDDPPLCSLEFLTDNKVENLNVILAVSFGILSTEQYGCKMASVEDIRAFCKSEYSVELLNHSFDHNNFSSLNVLQKIKDMQKNRDLLVDNFSDYYSDRKAFIVPRGQIDAVAILVSTLIGYQLYGVRYYKLPLGALYRSRTALYETVPVEDLLNLPITYTHDICEEPSVFGVTPKKFMRWARS